VPESIKRRTLTSSAVSFTFLISVIRFSGKVFSATQRKVARFKNFSKYSRSGSPASALKKPSQVLMNAAAPLLREEKFETRTFASVASARSAVSLSIAELRKRNLLCRL
jgi:hypothetical protein